MRVRDNSHSSRSEREKARVRVGQCQDSTAVQGNAVRAQESNGINIGRLVFG